MRTRSLVMSLGVSVACVGFVDGTATAAELDGMQGYENLFGE